MEHYLEPAQRALYKKTLMLNGIRTAGMNDADLESGYNGINGGLNNAAEPAKLEPAVVVQEKQPASVGDKIKAIKDKKKAPVKAPANVDKIAALLAGLVSDDAAPVDESRIIELIQEHSTTARPVEVINVADQSTVVIDSVHSAFDGVLTMARCRLNTLLCGEAGTGKTTLAKQISEALTLPFYYTGSILQKYELIGFIDAGGQYQSTTFRQAYENGGVFLFDELDGSAASALVAFNAALDNGFCAFPDGIIKMHPNFICLATANTKGRGANRKYQGRQALDGATLDRYQIVELDYCPNIEKNNALNEYKRHGGTTPKEASAIIDDIQAARAAAVNLGLNCIISPRASFAACRLLGAGMSKADALKVSLNNKLSDDERAQIEGAM